jgi:integrase
MRGKRTEGIWVRHSRLCATTSGGERCTCKPSYVASVYSVRDGKKIRKTFPTLAAAKGWREDAKPAVRKGTMSAPTPATLRDAATAWLDGAKAGTVRTRSGDRFKPSTLRGYQAAIERLLAELGGIRLSEVRRADLQDVADRMLGNGADPSTIRNALMPLRAIYRRHLARGDVAVNPTAGLELPAVRGKRDRVASPEEADKLLDALPPRDRPLWAVALYAGLRLGELRALRWPDVELDANLIRVTRSWDRREGEIEPKSRAGRRNVPIPAALRGYLLEHHFACGRPSDGFVFASASGLPFDPGTISSRAQNAWAAANLAPITLHEARHTFASLMIAAGVNAKALSTFMGHSSVTITYDRYGHLMPGSEDEAAALFDAYITASKARPSSTETKQG